MKQPETWLVTPENGPRPAGALDECYYCRAKVGEQHRPGCVCRKRTVLVCATVEYTVSVPDDWDVEMIEFARNESSWCASNMIAELETLNKDDCLCRLVYFEYVREATADDVERGVG